MRVGICSVGSELLSGDVPDTNAAWLAQRVLESGCALSFTVIVGDDREAIVDALRWLAGRSDVIIVGGGLGPTTDDLTRYAVADFAGAALRRDADLVSHLERVYGRLERAAPPESLRQADVPAVADIHEPKGTAAGFSLWARHDGRALRLHVLPGVPWEYRELAERAVLPDLVRQSGGRARVTRTLHIAGMGESAVAEALRGVTDRLTGSGEPRPEAEPGIDLAFLATDDEVLVKVIATGASPQAARDRAAPIVAEAAGLLGEAVTSVDESTLQHEIVRLLGMLGLTVATAETSTGGRIVSALSSVPGSAAHLRGGVVASAPESLPSLLGIGEERAGGVPAAGEDVVEAMALEIRSRCSADVGMASTAVVDTGAGDGSPAVTAIWGVTMPDGSVQVGRSFVPAADPDVIQARSASLALESLRRHLARLASPDR